MVTLSQSRLGTGAVTLVVWALAAGSLVYWGQRLMAVSPDDGAVPSAPSAPAVTVDPKKVAQVLGGQASVAPAAAPLVSRFSLQGVVAGIVGGGSALIAVDGKPAKPYRVGSPVEDGLVLKSVAARQASLAATPEGPVTVTLDMPPLKN